MEQHISIAVLSLMLLGDPSSSGVLREHPQVQEQETEEPREPIRITIRPTTVANTVDELAGQRVRVVNARVVGVFEPRAFLIEDATRYEAPVGMRDRVLVVTDGAGLQASPEVLVRSSVVILGVARTLLGLRVSPETPWPSKLDRDLIDRLEIRAAVLATSVQTPEGIELTERSGIDRRRPDRRDR